MPQILTREFAVTEDGSPRLPLAANQKIREGDYLTINGNGQLVNIITPSNTLNALVRAAPPANTGFSAFPAGTILGQATEDSYVIGGATQDPTVILPKLALGFTPAEDELTFGLPLYSSTIANTYPGPAVFLQSYDLGYVTTQVGGGLATAWVPVVCVDPAVAVQTTTTTANTGSQTITVTPASMTGIVNGSAILLDTTSLGVIQTTTELVYAKNCTATTFQCDALNAHLLNSAIVVQATWPLLRVVNFLADFYPGWPDLGSNSFSQAAANVNNQYGSVLCSICDPRRVINQVRY